MTMSSTAPRPKMGTKYETEMLYCGHEDGRYCGADIRRRVEGYLVMSDKPKTQEHIKVDANKCTGCRLCYELCPTGSYEMTEDGAADWSQFGMTHCGECGLCRYICPVDAIDWNYPEGGTGKIHKWS